MRRPGGKMKARQFVDAVTQRHGGDCLYSVSRIKPEDLLFYPSMAEAQAANTESNITLPSSGVAPPRMEMSKSLKRTAKLTVGAYRSDNMRLDFLPFYGRASCQQQRRRQQQDPGYRLGRQHDLLRRRRSLRAAGALPQRAQGRLPSLLLHRSSPRPRPHGPPGPGP